MPYLLHIKNFLIALACSAGIVLVLAPPSYATSELSFEWDGTTLKASGGPFDSMSESVTPRTFAYSAAKDGTYVNYTTANVGSNQCGIVLTLNKDKDTVTKANINAGAALSKPDVLLCNSFGMALANVAINKSTSTSVTPSGTREVVSPDAVTAARTTAVYNAIGKTNLDPIKNQYCGSFGSILGGGNNSHPGVTLEKCKDIEFPSYVNTCWAQGRTGAADASRYDPKTNSDAVTKSQFSYCMSQKTGISATTFQAAVASVDVSSVNKASDTAKDTVTTAAYKKDCEDGGGVWDDANSACTTGDTNEASSCSINGIGWIVCPVVNFLAQIADVAYNMLADNFLKVPSSIFDSPELNTAWKSFRDIANIILICGFLVMIYSQLTGAGLSNYSVKKLLPKIIVAAVLINLSFYICALSVDLSNILGYTLKSFLTGLGKTAAGNGLFTSGSTVSTGNGISWVVIATTALGASAVAAAASGGVTLALLGLLGALLSVIPAILMIFFILLLRQVAIILLIVMSPIAFSLYFLPNTKGWFDKWKKTFTALLMVFPVIGLIYGASAMASKILTSVGGGTDSMVTQIIGAAVMILPLYMVPGVLKKSLSSIGDIGAKLSAKGSSMGGKLKGSVTNSGFSKYQQRKSAKRGEQIRAGIYQGRGGKFNPSNWRSGVNSRVNNPDGTALGGRVPIGKWANSLSGGYTGLQAQRGASVIAAQDKEDMESAEAYVTSMNLSGNQLKDAVIKGSTTSGGKTIQLTEHQRRAAMRKFSPMMGAKDVEEIATASGGMSQPMRNEVTSGITSSGVAQKSPFVGGKYLGQIQAGSWNLEDAASDYAKNGVSAEQLAAMDAHAIASMYTAADNKARAGDSTPLRGLMYARDNIKASPTLSGKVKVAAQAEIDKIPK